MAKILMITSSYDKTCDYILSKYKNIDFFRLDFDDFSKYQVSFNNMGFFIERDNISIQENDCIAIYYRKPTPENLNNIFENKYQQFCHRESFSIVEGIVESFDGRCLSKPSIMRRSGNKLFQARIANKIDFKIPNYLITNSAELVHNFHGNNSIVKPLSVGTIEQENTKEFVQTNMFDPDIDLSALKFSPAYFQKYVSKDYESRVTFIGDKAFAVKIESENAIDWRKSGNKINYTECKMPDDVYRKCLQFMNECEMEFGCFDFIINNNAWYFLEMNVNGQWAWLEFETGLKISNALVEYLINA